MGLIRSLITFALVLGLVYCGAAVPVGERTMFQHIARIWKTDEAKDLREGVKESGGPVLERVKRGVHAGIDEAREARDGGVVGDGAAESRSPAAEL